MATKELNGKELQGFIKERQLRQVRNLRQAHGIVPKLVIIKTDHAPVAIDTYVRMKVAYAHDVLIEVEVRSVPQNVMPTEIQTANDDTSVQAMIIQLPLDDPNQTDELCDMITPEKDVDGLGKGAAFPSATAEAIDWLLAGYDVELAGKRIALLGRGKLVGAPLEKLWRARGLDVVAFDIDSGDVRDSLRASDIIVAATGVPGRLTSDDVASGAVVVDAGTASEGGVLVGDAAPDLRQRDDITMTPLRGGVGPLTIAVLFDHVIQACLKQAGKL